MDGGRYKIVYVSRDKQTSRQRYALVVLALCAVLVGVLVGLWRTPPHDWTHRNLPDVTGRIQDSSKSSLPKHNGINSPGTAGDSQGPGYANGNGSLGLPAYDGPGVAESGSLGSEVPALAHSPDSQSLNLPEVLIMIPGVQNPGAGKSEASPATSGAKEHPIRLVSYTVEKGDTLTRIAAKFNTTVNSIVAINGLTAPDSIAQGHELAIMENGAGTVCRVERGDTLSEISRVYGVPVDIIMEANNLSDPQNLSPGQLLLLPGTKITATSLQVAAASRSSTFSWPVTGKVTDGYGWRTHPITGKRQFHEGIDIAASSGTAVRAAASGTVTFAGWSNGYGRLVVVGHGEGYETKYGHLSRYAVSKGAKVSKGDTLGYVGQSGDATGPHLHFEITVSRQPKNPRNYLP
jgi:murein DD-endopeptidase MepM/ murein hydrolase activator NlpD